MASEQILAGKKARVSEVAELLKNSCAGVIVDYKGITVEEDTKLRKELREAGVNYFVEKNSILRFALKEAGVEGLDNVLQKASSRLRLVTSAQTSTTKQALWLFQRSRQETYFSLSSLVHSRVLSRSSLRFLRQYLKRTEKQLNYIAA